MEPTKEEAMKEAAEMMKQLEKEDLQKLKGVIVGIQLARDTENIAV